MSDTQGVQGIQGKPGGRGGIGLKGEPGPRGTTGKSGERVKLPKRVVIAFVVLAMANAGAFYDASQKRLAGCRDLNDTRQELVSLLNRGDRTLKQLHNEGLLNRKQYHRALAEAARAKKILEPSPCDVA
jgi:hypothetical protein